MPKTEITGRIRAAVCLLAVLLVPAGLAACGSSSSGSASNTTTGATAAKTGAVATVPASQPAKTSPNGKTRSAPTATTTAPRAAGKTAKAVTPRNAAAAQAAFRKALVSFASCLRSNGVKIPNPNTSGKGPIFGTKGIKTNTPQFRAAALKCRSVLASALRANAPKAATQTKR